MEIKTERQVKKCHIKGSSVGQIFRPYIRGKKLSISIISYENNNYIRKERTYGSYTRRFDLSGIKSDGISASYKDGILTLTLPKEEVKVDTGRTLEIK